MSEPVRPLPSPAPAAPGGARRADARLFAAYDRLRARVVDTAERRGRRYGRPAAEVLLLAPDIFVLLSRLALDRDVPTPARTLIGGALAYFILPFDLFPEAVVGGVGYLDDIVVAAAVLSQTLGGDLEPYAEKYWSGKQDLRVVLHDIADSARHLLGGRLFARVERLLHRRGVRLRR